MHIISLKLATELCASEHAVCATHVSPAAMLDSLCDVDKGSRLPSLENLPAWGSVTLRLDTKGICTVSYHEDG